MVSSVYAGHQNHINNYNAVVMVKGRLLGGFENLLLLVILRLDDRAYGVAIR